MPKDINFHGWRYKFECSLQCDFKESGLKLYEFPFNFLYIHIIEWQVIFSHSLYVYSAYCCVGKVVWLLNANDVEILTRNIIFRCRKSFSSLSKCWSFRLKSLDAGRSAVCAGMVASLACLVELKYDYSLLTLILFNQMQYFLPPSGSCYHGAPISVGGDFVLLTFE